MAPLNNANFFIPKDGSKGSQIASTALNAGQNLMGVSDTGDVIQSIIALVPSLWDLAGIDENANAEKEVGEKNSKETSLKASIESTREKVNSDMSTIINKLEENAQTIKTNIENAEKKQEEKEKAQKELEKQTQTIAVCKGILENPNSVSGERTVAIAKLKEANAAITSYMANIENLFNAVKDSQKVVSEVSEENTNLNSQISVIQEEGQEKVKTYSDEYLKQITENNTMKVLGNQNKVTAKAAGDLATTLEASAKGSSFIPFAGGLVSGAAETEAQQMRGVQKTHDLASGTRISGAGDVTAKLNSDKTFIGQIDQDITNFVNNAVGSYNEGLNFTQVFNPMIESLGSYVQDAMALKDQPEALNTAIQSAETSVAQNDGNAAKNDSQNDGENNSDKQQGQFTFQYDPSALNKLFETV